ncbi:MAG: H4MPT-linked C1 transfer pathway protein [Candidatus Bathyarchaeota archaeon]|nr:H4MPT-linked C1 transfer pathway protein [Candidatus Bathyarchaeota archaeon]
MLGLDIGGANTKAALITVNKGELQNVSVVSQYFPVWKNPEKLVDVLLELKEKLGGEPEAVGITMTAELSDAYQTKREGITHIFSCVQNAFKPLPVYVLTVDTEVLSPDIALQNPLKVASANWAATGWLVAQKIRNCVVVDVGSTSTSIIPIIGGVVSAVGKTDLEKLVCGELVYTGSIRTNIAAIVGKIPTKAGVAKVSSELFAQSGDVHLILGNITPQQYTADTADGRGKTVPEALARLARIVCADTDMLSEKEIIDMAHFIYQRQIVQVSEGLGRVYSRVKAVAEGVVPVVVTGLGKEFLAKEATKKICADQTVNLGGVLQENFTLATPAVAVALMTAQKTFGGQNSWT